MRSPSAFKQICYGAFALLLFAVRSADAHVHMCLDGQEPLASLHVADAGVHHTDAGVQQQHNDKDVKYASDGTFKKGESADLLLVATVWSLVNFLSPYTAERPPHVASTPVLPVRAYLRPPLRGPPR